MARAPSAEWYHDRPAREREDLPEICRLPQVQESPVGCDPPCHTVTLSSAVEPVTDREGTMGSETIWKADMAVANPHPLPSKAMTDRAAMLADIAARRRQAQMRARHALAASDAVCVAEPLAS